ncbi:hypothetical protein P154DRAFT_518223 [Amniculicola lignicola CBS 123094]|uniref:Uncharacterized protein n=1 Tax=Amniculicola lignicola CBS 123094 TaxID=1392246 RepID=A0A6A5X0F0_9PLEO|nr:hypothetical protein P154DRAFT_518223 [Amniculicola lignicola CBS 123094]
METIPFDRQYSDSRSLSRASHRLRARRNRYASFRHITPGELPSAPTPPKHYRASCIQFMCYKAGKSHLGICSSFPADLSTAPVRTLTKREAYDEAQDKNNWRSAPKQVDWRGYRESGRGLCVGRKRARENKEAREYVKDQYVWGEELFELQSGGHGDCSICLGRDGPELDEKLVGPSEAYFGARAVKLAACFKGPGDEGYESEEVGEHAEEETVVERHCACQWWLPGKRLWDLNNQGENRPVSWVDRWDCCDECYDDEECEEEEHEMEEMGETVEDVGDNDEEDDDWDILSVTESVWTEISDVDEER